MRFRGKQVLVTGGASGIGRASAQRFAAEGANVVVADIDTPGVERVAADLRSNHGVEVSAVTFDARSASSCAAMVEQAASNLGGKLDVLCNIAGVMDWDRLEQFSADRWDRVLEINLSGIFYVTRTAMPHLVKSRGNVVNMSSAAALVGVPYSAAYCASKAGLVGLTKSLAVEFASAGVRVNAICPTGVRTSMHANNKFPDNADVGLIMRNAPKLFEGNLSEPEDIAAAVLFVASDEARYLSGVALPVDGAQTAG